MTLNIVKCVSTIEEFSKEEFEDLNIGVEVQDLIGPELESQEIQDLVDKYRDLLGDFPNTKSLHGPFLDLKPSSPDEDIRRLSQAKYRRALGIARELDMDYIIFHSQINPWLKEPRIRDLNNRQAREFWQTISEEFKDFQGKILIENIFEDQPLFLRELIETIDLANIRVCLDIGHARLEGNQPLETWFKELGPSIEYIHLHWNRGLYDEHMLPADEDIEYIKELLAKYGVSPIIALEYKVEELEREIIRIKSI